MKALVYAGPKQVEVQEVKEPEKQDGKVKLNIRYCGATPYAVLCKMVRAYINMSVQGLQSRR